MLLGLRSCYAKTQFTDAHTDTHTHGNTDMTYAHTCTQKQTNIHTWFNNACIYPMDDTSRVNILQQEIKR